MLALVLFAVCTVYPVIRSFVRAPPIEIPLDLNTVLKLISFPAGYESFREHLVTEFNTEHIVFWKVAGEFQQLCYESSLVQQDEDVPIETQHARYVTACHVFDTFIRQGSHHQVNISGAQVAQISRQLEDFQKGDIHEISPDLFGQARFEVLTLLGNDSFPRYIGAGKWKEVADPELRTENEHKRRLIGSQSVKKRDAVEHFNLKENYRLSMISSRSSQSLIINSTDLAMLHTSPYDQGKRSPTIAASKESKTSLSAIEIL